MVVSLVLLACSSTSRKDEPATGAREDVFDGTEVPTGEFLWMSSVHGMVFGIGQQLFCGGALVDAEFVLSARHCVNTWLTYPQAIGVGTNASNPTTSLQPTAQLIWIAQGTQFWGKRIFFPDDQVKWPNGPKAGGDIDLALIQLAKPATGIEPVAYGGADTEYATGATGTLLGWGATHNALIPRPVSTLREATVTVTPTDVCEASMQANGYKGKNLFCAGNADNDYASAGCDYDSGGPLYSADSKSVVGILSSNNPSNPAAGTCGKPGQPDTYTNVSDSAGWIRDTVSANKTS